MKANPKNPSKGQVPAIAIMLAAPDGEHRARLVYGWDGAGVVAIVIDRYNPKTGRRAEMMTIRPDANGDAWVEAVPGAPEWYHEMSRETGQNRVSFAALAAFVS